MTPQEEITTSTNLMDLCGVGHIVETWERELDEYSERTSEQVPDQFKVSLLLRTLPPEHESEIRMRHVTNQLMTYAVSRQQIETWVHQRLQRAATSSLMSFPREPEDQEDEGLDALKAKGRSRNEPRPNARPVANRKPSPGGLAK